MEEGKVNRLKSMPSVGAAVNKFYENYREAAKQGKTTCRIIGYPLPHVILRTHDINYMYLPSYAATTSARHVSGKLLDVAEEAGYLREICSYTRCNIGAALVSAEMAAEDPMYAMPKPDFILVTESSCSMTTNWGDAERRIYDVPLFTIYDPYVWDEADEKEAVAEVTHQLREFIIFLEDITHRAFDWDRYRETMAVAKETAGLRIHTMDLACQTVPSPATVFDWTALLALINYYIGLPEGRDIALTIREEILERIKNKEGAVIPEKYRLYWDGIMIWPYLGRIAKKCAALSANVIWTRYCSNSFWQHPDEIDLEHPLESNALQIVHLHFNHNIDWLIDTVSDTCQRYSVDGLLIHANLTCRTMAGPQFEIMEGVSRKLGIPAVYFEGDMADDTLISESQIDTRLEALIEIIEARKRK
jgi:benzoyl-CoA reductase/2-hydroxyglutaryl-CoA dehydratase subunit BcrC/BadD/HgdB